MTEFFGISMTYIMIALLALLAVAFSSVGWVLVRNRVMFNIGVRNIPRRRAQTVLIIVGLMLSTLIIATAFSIGDTVEYSITSTAYDRLQSIDEIVQTDTSESDDPFSGGGSLVTALPIPQGQADQFIEAFKATDGVDGALAVVRGPVAVSNPSKGQTEPIAILVGIDAAQMDGFQGDVQTLAGARVTPDDLGSDEVYVNESAADELDITPGDVLTVFVAGTPVQLTVKDVVRDRVLTGTVAGQTNGMLVSLARAQELLGREGEVDFIAVSNEGGARDGLAQSEEVTKAINFSLSGTRWTALETKQEAVDAAAQTASFLVTFFVVLGLFSIAAGMLLIFLIFVMLAAERKMEMGMVRAVGTKRRHLVEIFLSEGMVYNVGAAAVGCALGIGVAVVMIGIMARLFADFDLSITFHVTARSLIVSYSLGVVLTFLTVVFSSWRIGNLNIVSAIRDAPEPALVPERPRRGVGFWGIVSYLRWLLIKPSSLRGFLTSLAIVLTASLAIAGGSALFLVAGELYGSSAAGGVLAVLLGVLGGFVIAAAALTVLLALNAIFQPGPVMVAAAPALLVLGWVTAQGFPFGVGLTLLIIGAALVIRYMGAPARPVFSAMGFTMLFFWLLFAGNNVPGVKEMEGDIEMFFLSGVTMVIAATFLLVYNADLLLGGLTLLGGVLSTLVPSIRTAVAYPLANKFRTGMTIAMISLVMFALVMMSTMNGNFDRIFLSDDSLGGYDIIVIENPGNPINDLVQALDATNADGSGGGGNGDTFDTSAIKSVDTLEVANRSVAEVRNDVPRDEYQAYPTYGLSQSFIENNELKFQARATGLDSDAAVWESLARNPDQVVVDAFALPSEGFGNGAGFQVEGIDPTATTFDPVTLIVRDAATNTSRRVEVVGVLAVSGSAIFGGLLMPPDSFEAVFPRPESTLHYVRLQDGADANDTAKGIERTLLAQGAQADSLRQLISDFQAQSRAFLYLIQGFMGIGLFVGIAAVGVVAFRTVVERRQQIGMLRAIGYTRRAVALSFVMESSFTALLGIFSGIGLALLLAYQLVKTDEFVPGGVDSFYIPWGQIGVVALFAFLASLIMTIIPSRQASSIPIAEALRYE